MNLLRTERDTRALAFHPSSRAAAAGPIARYLADGPLIL
jgi:hypothetical protein